MRMRVDIYIYVNTEFIDTHKHADYGNEASSSCRVWRGLGKTHM